MQLRQLKNTTRGWLGRQPGILFAALALTLATAAIVVAATNAASTVPAPVITSTPANPTNQTSASFTYSDSQTGVTFRCQLDTAAYASCPSSGVSYTGLTPGSHAFKVQAVAGTKTSSATSYTWTIDTTPPSLGVSFPTNGGAYGAAAWSKGCSGSAGICGTAKDPSGVSSVILSIRRGSGNWWGGSAFDEASEYFNAANLALQGSTSTSWSYPLALPPDGTYTIHVRGTDRAGNTTPEGSQLVSTFTIDTTPPPVPTITSGPETTTTAKTATFTFTDSEAGTTFLCRLDGGSFSNCSSPKSYEISQGEHQFYVEARDAVGNVSTASSYAWTVVKSGEGKSFAISGNLLGSLAPGVSRTLALTVSNPNNVPIYVTSLTVSVQPGSTNAGCDGPTNLEVRQSNASPSNALPVPANGQVTLPAGGVSAPLVAMKDLSSNQDACKGASFTFSYAGTAHS